MLVHSTLPRSTVNGPGERAVVWFQGCDLRCPGCWNPSTTGSTEAVTSPLMKLGSGFFPAGEWKA